MLFFCGSLTSFAGPKNFCSNFSDESEVKFFRIVFSAAVTFGTVFLRPKCGDRYINNRTIVILRPMST